MEANAKMTTMIGTLAAFDGKEQSWEEYCEILEQFFEANGIDDGEKQRTILISVVGPATYKLIRNLSFISSLTRVAVYLDDIILTGRDEAEHLSTLDEVLSRLKDAGLRLHRSKCAFLQNEVEYLGHVVNAEGLHPVQDKVRAIEGAPPPTTVTEAYLGLLNYYNKFLPSLATRLAPLHKLLRKNVLWAWNREQEEAFQSSKQLLKSAKVLGHYSADKALVLACDASPHGVGAVLLHVMEDGSERPLGFMSRTLTPAEKRYSELNKEGLAIIFGIKRFHKYIYGRTFTISTDHKPLISLFHEKKPVPQMGP
ncbi:hypothetical protein DPEC_G00259470 [Dallia pectoralis]|uniref:Uncharacterized protein n=1 Tax=Dallia pectoralis TaxID=75939 RepID=A0ACC2FRC4_DALPE|nr:hypothetical protein DPEC_G00259470 [Dallia pectoralis]